MLQFLFIYNHIPSFWHFWLTAGLRTLDGEFAVMREAVAKKAAMDIILQTGLAYSGGREFSRITRDQVSEEIRFERGTPGARLYEEYRTWLFGDPRTGRRGHLYRFKQRFTGLAMVVL